jgi:hypothetical protein
MIVHSTIFVLRVSPQNENKTRVNHIHYDYIRASPRDSKSFLNARNRDFGENYPPTAFPNGHPNIAIFYFVFFTSQK